MLPGPPIVVLNAPASLQGRVLLLVLAASLAVWLGIAALTWRDARRELDGLFEADAGGGRGDAPSGPA